MMKKLVLMLMLVLGITSVAWASPYFRISPADQKDHYSPSDLITIEVLDDHDVNSAGFMIDWITDNTGGAPLGTADEPQLFHPSYKFTYPGMLNTNYTGLGELVIWAAGSAGDADTDEVLYSFEYHVPTVPLSTWIEIQTDWDDDWCNAPKFDYTDSTSYIGAVTPVMIHVIPEPTTIALLGLGGLLLRRRK